MSRSIDRIKPCKGCGRNFDTDDMTDGYCLLCEIELKEAGTWVDNPVGKTIESLNRIKNVLQEFQAKEKSKQNPNDSFLAGLAICLNALEWEKNNLIE